MDASAFGINGGWGIRTTAAFVDKFSANTTDTRTILYGWQTKEIKNIGTFTDGYAIQKFRNVTVNGVQGSDKAGISLTLTSQFSVWRMRI
jgi:hypothetical protein